MRIGITGYNGYIAQAIIKKLENKYEIVKVGRKDDADVYLDLEDISTFDKMAFEDMDYLIHTAAVSGPDMCEKEYNRCWKINVESTKTIIQQALDSDCKVLFFSSDAVYGDISGKIYKESDVLQPSTAYGKMKCEIEQYFKNVANFKALRLSYVVSLQDKFVSYCLDKIYDDDKIEVFHPFYRTCTTLCDVLDVTEWCLNNWDKFPERAINVCGKELVSRVRIVDEIGRILDKKVNYLIKEPDIDFFINRPKITQTWPCVIEKYSIVEIKSFTEKILKEFKMEDNYE